MTPPAAPQGPARFRRHSLTAKQAVLTLGIAMLLSILAGAIELASDARSMRQEVEHQTRHLLALVNGTAAEAAFQLNPVLAAQVAEGLWAGGHVASVTIRDDFDRVMATRERPSEAHAGWLADALFGDILHYRETLTYELGSGEPASAVGEIELSLAPGSLSRAFIDRSLLVFSLGMLKALAIAALVVVVFHVFITRPLLRVHAAIAETDPRHPGRWPKPRLERHIEDELGHLVESLDDLLNAFQHGLNQRDALHQISTLDGLTGIANRRRFDSFMADSWQRARRTRRPLSVIFLDIDNFKGFNDHYGHVSGDDTLRAVAGALTRVVTRATDLVARYGGEEFVCILPDTDLEGARRVANRIRDAILALDIPHAGSEHAEQVTASFGIACATPGDDDMSCEQLLEQADRQLYRAKHQGRDRIVWQE
ncbi:diguanylate cyclase [Halomonas kalidii]|uniref:diguanylate cyclase n=1 Tax=Halomonas kalidii TaxID=3043293 RepID=A0ABT6VKJ2_9GAMM|nr:GGDEF domain-containing protein [Halomonas kalidii]MDI5934499.1 diguanylate cyclase [Halomonas kalidii]